MNLAHMNLAHIRYINEEKNMKLNFIENKPVEKYKEEIRKIMNKIEPNNDRKLIFDIPTNLMTDAQVVAANNLKQDLQSKDDISKNPKKVAYTEISLNKNTNKTNLEQIYNQLGWEFNRNLTNNDLYQHLLTQEKRKFKVKKL
jgi:hypothetical protein